MISFNDLSHIYFSVSLQQKLTVLSIVNSNSILDILKLFQGYFLDISIDISICYI